AEGKFIYQDEEVTAFWDRRPVTQVHILIMPNKHIQSVNQMTESDAHLIGKLTLIAKQIAVEQRVDQSGYRLVINTGPDAGQSVFHLHMHLIAGQRMGFRPS
ncbi:MAG: HIT domain-containing protein, partial [bacterium]